MSAFNSTHNAAHKGNLAAKHEADANAKKEARKEAKRQKSKGGGASSSVHPSDASDATPAGVAPPSEDTALQEMTKKLHSARRQFIAVKKAEGNRIVVRRPAYAVASATKRDFCGLAKRAAIDVILVHDKERFTSATVHIASLSDVGDKGEFSIVLEEDLDDVDSKVLGRRGAAGELDSMHTQMSVEARISQCLSSDTHKVAIALAVDDEGVPKPIPQGKIDYRSIGMLLAVVLYFAMGLIFYTQHEGWTFTDSLYFCMVTVTTVGYGDQGSFYADGATSTAITDSDEAMLFTAFFVAYGIGVISVCLSYAIEKLMAAKDAAMHALQESALDALLDEDVDDEADDEETNRKEEAEEKAAKSSMAFVSTALSWLVVLIIFGLGILVMTLEEPATNRFVHALYWLVITGTTVGYGDLGPTTDGGKWFCIFYLLLLTATVAKLVSDFADWVTKEDEAAKNVKKDMRFSEELLQALDLNGDKRIMKWEWLAGMLVRLQYVKPDAVARILVHFDKSNIDGDDELDIDDLRPTKARKERLVRRSMAQQAPVELRDGGDDDPELMSVESSLKDVAKQTEAVVALSPADRERVQGKLDEIYKFVQERSTSSA